MLISRNAPSGASAGDCLPALKRQTPESRTESIEMSRRQRDGNRSAVRPIQAQVEGNYISRNCGEIDVIREVLGCLEAIERGDSVFSVEWYRNIKTPGWSAYKHTGSVIDQTAGDVARHCERLLAQHVAGDRSGSLRILGIRHQIGVCVRDSKRLEYTVRSY